MSWNLSFGALSCWRSAWTCFFYFWSLAIDEWSDPSFRIWGNRRLDEFSDELLTGGMNGWLLVLGRKLDNSIRRGAGGGGCWSKQTPLQASSGISIVTAFVAPLMGWARRNSCFLICCSGKSKDSTKKTHLALLIIRPFVKRPSKSDQFKTVFFLLSTRMS